MGSAAQKYSADVRIRQIREQQKAIEKYIDSVLFEIRRVESGELADFWVVIRGGGATSSYKVQLEKKLQGLRRQLASLRRQGQEIRLAAVRSHTRQVTKNNRMAARKILKDAEKRGELSANEEKKLLRHADSTLRASINLLKEHPTRKNLKDAMDALGDYMKVGGDDAGIDRAMNLFSKVAEKRFRISEKRFRKEPTGENLKLMLGAQAEGMVLSQGYMKPPRPLGLKPPWPEKSHKVQPGETLAQISRDYYGSPGYWDVIYLANYGVIGDNYRAIRPGVVLLIPGSKLLH